MGNKNGGHSVDEDDDDTKNIYINEKVRVKQRPRKRFVFIIAMCCSTVVNAVEPEETDLETEKKDKPAPTSHLIINNIVAPPKKPLNSKPRVRRYGYGFTTKIQPLVLSAEDLEELKEVGDQINEEQKQTVESNFFISSRDGPCPVEFKFM